MPPGLPLVSVILGVNTMNLTTLITAPDRRSEDHARANLAPLGRRTMAFSVSGQRQPDREDAIGAARGIQSENIAIRVGLAGLPGTPRTVTATTFTPSSNIASAARQIA
jgi:hypothetical protein